MSSLLLRLFIVFSLATFVAEASSLDYSGTQIEYEKEEAIREGRRLSSHVNETSLIPVNKPAFPFFLPLPNGINLTYYSLTIYRKATSPLQLSILYQSLLL